MGYLHRTVKDFLESRAIWPQLVAATEDSFDPNISLCRSFVLKLKCTESGNEIQSPNRLWGLISWVIDYASKAEDTQVTRQLGLLDELEHTATQLFSQKNAFGNSGGTKVSSTYHWTTTLSHTSTRNNFLNLAVQSQLTLYLEGKLKQNSLGVLVLSSLLATAVSNYEISIKRSDGPAFTRSKPSIQMIKLLLEQGADPNHSIYGCTPWEQVFEQLPRPDTAEKNVWEQIVKMFQQHGAKLSKKSYLLGAGKFNESTLLERKLEGKLQHIELAPNYYEIGDRVEGAAPSEELYCWDDASTRAIAGFWVDEGTGFRFYESYENIVPFGSSSLELPKTNRKGFRIVFGKIFCRA